MSASLQSGVSRAADWTRGLVRSPATPAATALALYTFLLLSRLPELFTFIGVFRPMILVALLTVALAWILPRARMDAVLTAPESRAVLGIFGLALAGIPTSHWPGGSFNFVVVNFSKTVLFYFLVVYCVRGLMEIRYLVLASFGAMAALELGVLLFNATERVRITGTYDPNDLAAVIVCTLPMAVMLLLTERALRYAVLPVVLLGLVTIIMTKSRGGFITLVVVSVIVLVKLPSRIPLLRTGLVIAGILVFSLFAPQAYWDRIATIWGESEAVQDGYVKEGFSPRWNLWMTGMRLMLENPILGVGASAFSVAESGQTFGRGMYAAHNSFTQIGAELGIFGLALFVYLLYRGIRNYRTVIRVARSVPQLRYYLWTAHGLEAGMYGYIVAGAALNHAYSAILYYLLAMSVVLRWQTLRERARLNGPEAGRQATAHSLPWWKAAR